MDYRNYSPNGRDFVQSPSHYDTYVENPLKDDSNYNPFDPSLFNNLSQESGFADPLPWNCSEHLKFLDDMKDYSAPSQVVVPIVYCIICVVGLIGNGLVRH